MADVLRLPEEPSSLRDWVQCLQLPPERMTVNRVASTLTQGDSVKVGFLREDDWESAGFSMRYLAPEAGANRVIQQLRDDRQYMNATDISNFGHARYQKVVLEYVKADSKFDPEDRLELLDFSNSLALRLFEKKLQDKHKGKIPPMLSFRSISLDEYRQRRHGPPPNSPEDPAPLTLSPVAFNLGGHLNEPGQSDQYSHAMLKAQAWHALFNLVSPSRTPESELEVQQNIGHAMRHVLTIGNSSLKSDKAIRFPQTLQLSASHHPSPDFALCIHMDPSLLNDSSLTEQINPNVRREDMNPVVLGGEAKTAITGTGRSPDPPPSAVGKPSTEKPGVQTRSMTPSFRSQLQASVYSTLVLLILLYALRNDRRVLPHETTMHVQLSAEFYVYGVYYDEEEVRIYAYFPYYRRRGVIMPGIPETTGWRFAQVLMKIYKFPRDLTPDISLSLGLAIGLQVVRTQAERLRGVFLQTYREEWKVILRLGYLELQRELQTAVELRDKEAQREADIRKLEGDIRKLEAEILKSLKGLGAAGTRGELEAKEQWEIRCTSLEKQQQRLDKLRQEHKHNL